ncbi:MAG: hypothetical protein KatS3mg111_4351 [Pirellulaceae bacterium]|nr:MAG: hypothetical protein KatS3mg111_4351 [Pirellulaceae bacterium]
MFRGHRLLQCVDSSVNELADEERSTHPVAPDQSAGKMPAQF